MESDHNIKSIRRKFKEQGVFYTDTALAELMKSYMPEGLMEVYDPTCGDGALLSVFPDGVAKYGQELDPQQAQSCRERVPGSIIADGDTLLSPAFMGRKFRGIVANYPFSKKYDPQAAAFTTDPRFAGMPCLAPPSKGDFMFLAHILYYLAPDGIAAVLNFPGICYRGGREERIRRWMLSMNVIDEVTDIEGGYFVDTKIATSLWILRRDRGDKETIMMADHRSGQRREVPLSEILADGEGCNLSPPRYIDLAEEKPEIDIDALEARIARLRARREVLEKELDELLKELK